jgi:hypothetical protein
MNRRRFPEFVLQSLDPTGEILELSADSTEPQESQNR